jgi:hypothetical protein
MRPNCIGGEWLAAAAAGFGAEIERSKTKAQTTDLRGSTTINLTLVYFVPVERIGFVLPKVGSDK